MKLHNLTFYVARDEFDGMRAFSPERIGLPVVSEEPGHTCCFGIGGEMAIGIHASRVRAPSWVAGAIRVVGRGRR